MSDIPQDILIAAGILRMATVRPISEQESERVFGVIERLQAENAELRSVLAQNLAHRAKMQEAEMGGHPPEWAEEVHDDEPS
jgi:hypothetical protein